jgi:CopA family copper-resistance protein
MKIIQQEQQARRRFVKGLAVGGAVAGLGLTACSSTQTAGGSQSQVAINANKENELKGKVFNLSLEEQRVNFTGKTRIATAINGTVPGPTLHWKEGETITLNVTNKLSVDSSIHWHGIILPNKMDGVPGLTYEGIKPGETFKYRFKVTQSGTYWYHSHSGFQEQTGMHGAIVIEPKKAYPFEFDREFVVSLADWSDEDPNRIYSKLKKLSHYYNFKERTVGELFKEIQKDGLKKTFNNRKMWNEMRMSQRDLSDVTGYTYTYLMNNKTPRDGWRGIFKPGEKVLLRFVNTSAMSFFDVRIPGLKMTVVASDGQYIQPVSVDEFRIGVAENYDVIDEPDGSQAYTIFAQSLGRSGYARGTLAPNAMMTAAVPKVDTAPNLTHMDMGMDMSSMSGMDHSGMDMGGGSMAGKDMSKMDHSKMKMGNMAGGMDCSDPMHASMDACKNKDKKPMAQMDMSKMDHSKMKMGGSMKGMDHSSMNKGDMGGGMDMNSAKRVKHAATEYGPHVDMRAEAPRLGIDDPGIGLRNNGRKVLSYADLKNLYPTKDKRKPSREVELHLTGNMSRYMWSINGVKYADAKPIIFKHGERIRITLVNDTMMSHPMHLHGLWSELETGDDNYLPRKHTVIVQPGAKVSYLVTADARGRWAYHCHLLYHMLGMFREVRVV